MKSFLSNKNIFLGEIWRAKKYFYELSSRSCCITSMIQWYFILENIWRAKIYQVGTQFAKVLKGTMTNCEQWATRKIFGGREFLSHRDFFLLHRAKKILSKKKGEKVRVRNIVSIVVNHSCCIQSFTQMKELEPTNERNWKPTNTWNSPIPRN